MASEVQRRLRLNLDLGADDIRSLGDGLRQIANDLELDGREARTVTSGGWSSGYHLELVLTDPEMTGDKYRELLRGMMKREDLRVELTTMDFVKRPVCGKCEGDGLDTKPIPIAQHFESGCDEYDQEAT